MTAGSHTLTSPHTTHPKTPTSTESPHPNKHGDLRTFTSGDIAAVVLGGVAGLALVVAGIVFMLRARRRKYGAVQSDWRKSGGDYSDIKQRSGIDRPLELYTEEVHEMSRNNT